MKVFENAIIAAMIAVMIFVLAAAANNLRAETKPIEFVIPVSCCSGGANDMARQIKVIVDRHGFTSRNIMAVNKPTGPASEGYVYLRQHRGDANKIGMALTSIFSHSIANPQSGFHYSQLTPIAMMARDDFILWVPASTPFQTSEEFFQHVKANPNTVTLGGLSVKQEDQIVTAAIEQSRSIQIVYVPYRSGGEIAQQLAGGHVDSSVNNPSEGVQFWQSGKIRPLCVFSDRRIPYREIIANGMSWNDIPTCREQGTDVIYKMMRAVFAPPDLDPAAKQFYQDLLRKVSDTAEWQQYVRHNALEPKFVLGSEFDRWLAITYQQHHNIMSRSGWITR